MPGPAITPARIGTLYFKYTVPDVEVTAESRTKEHEIIEGANTDDSIVVQQLGRRPDGITVTTTVADYETGMVDDLTKMGEMSLRTFRWSGTVIVESTTTRPLNALDKDGDWLYEVTIECIEVEESKAPATKDLGGAGFDSGSDSQNELQNQYDSIRALSEDDG